MHPTVASHPKEILRDLYLKRILEFLDSDRDIDDDMADHLSLTFGTTKELWLALQRVYDEGQREKEMV